jgi:pyrroline-5-carboxylate reductase
VLIINPGNPVSTGEVRDRYGVVPAAPEALCGADVIIVAVKPQSFPEAARAYKNFIGPDPLVISIMAGISLSDVEAALGVRRTVRVMPNLGLAVGYGASGYAPGSFATEDDMEVTCEIFSASGLAVRVAEDKINDVAALSGSGAAYIYYLLEALRDAATEDGFDPAPAAALARQTLLGAAKLLELEDAPPEELRRRITSKKGTTEAAIKKMAEMKFPEAVKAGYRANKARSEELSDEISKPERR